MKNITDIYSEYKIMPMLSIHQIRVAAVANMICDSLSVPIDKDNIIKACLLHDIANIIKFDLNFPIQNEPTEINYWQQVKDEYIIKYGKNEHEASVKIAKELGLSNRVVELIASVDSAFIVDGSIKNNNDFGKKICSYADGRVTPHNVASIKDRNEEARKRYENHPHSFSEESRHLFISGMEDIEKEIFSHANIKPEDINDDSIQSYIDKLKTAKIF
jgi:hypothetical protein